MWAKRYNLKLLYLISCGGFSVPAPCALCPKAHETIARHSKQSPAFLQKWLLFCFVCPRHFQSICKPKCCCCACSIMGLDCRMGAIFRFGFAGRDVDRGIPSTRSLRSHATPPPPAMFRPHGTGFGELTMGRSPKKQLPTNLLKFAGHLREYIHSQHDVLLKMLCNVMFTIQCINHLLRHKYRWIFCWC